MVFTLCIIGGLLITFIAIKLIFRKDKIWED